MPSRLAKIASTAQLASTLRTASASSSKIPQAVKQVTFTVPDKNMPKGALRFMKESMTQLMYDNPSVPFNVKRLVHPSSKALDPAIQKRAAETTDLLLALPSSEGNNVSSLAKLVIDLNEGPSKTLKLKGMPATQILEEILSAGGGAVGQTTQTTTPAAAEEASSSTVAA